MKNSTRLIGIILFISLFSTTCQREPQVEQKSSTVISENSQESLDSFCCSVKITKSGTGTCLSLCGIAQNGWSSCHYCSSGTVFGTGGTFDEFHERCTSHYSFPWHFGVANSCTTTQYVDVTWYCGPEFCGNIVYNVPVPAQGSVIMVLDQCFLSFYSCD